MKKLVKNNEEYLELTRDQQWDDGNFGGVSPYGKKLMLTKCMTGAQSYSPYVWMTEKLQFHAIGVYQTVQEALLAPAEVYKFGTAKELMEWMYS